MDPDLRIETPRLVLRDFREDDWPAVHEYASDPEVVQYMIWGPNTEDETRRFMATALDDRRHEPRTRYALGIALRPDGPVVGGCRLELSGASADQATIGYVLSRRYWGQGFATEVARRLVAFGFERLGLHRISATCDARNRASARVLEKTGMRREGHCIEDVLVRGQWRDSYQYAILRREWEKRAQTR